MPRTIVYGTPQGKDKVISRHLTRGKADAKKSFLLIESGRRSQSRKHSSGNARLDYKVERGFLHYKVLEV